MSKAPAAIMYASVVFRVTLRKTLMTVIFDDFDVELGDILNAYVQAPVTERVWTTLGHEFGKDAKKTAGIARALYGLKSVAANF